MMNENKRLSMKTKTHRNSNSNSKLKTSLHSTHNKREGGTRIFSSGPFSSASHSIYAKWARPCRLGEKYVVHSYRNIVLVLKDWLSTSQRTRRHGVRGSFSTGRHRSDDCRCRLDVAHRAGRTDSIGPRRRVGPPHAPLRRR